MGNIWVDMSRSECRHSEYDDSSGSYAKCFPFPMIAMHIRAPGDIAAESEYTSDENERFLRFFCLLCTQGRHRSAQTIAKSAKSLYHRSRRPCLLILFLPNSCIGSTASCVLGSGEY